MRDDRLADLWPASGLVVRSGDLELRWIDDDLLVDLATVASHGIHGDDLMPFNVPWTRGSARDVARSVLTYQWGIRPLVASAGRFALELGVIVGGVPVGIQGASGSDWGTTKTLETGSWLGREFQGQRIGTRMRAAFVWALFEGLGAKQLTSGAFADNAPSAAVSERLSYESSGTELVDREGVATTQHRYLLTRERWEALRPQHQALLGADVDLVGFETLREELNQELK